MFPLKNLARKGMEAAEFLAYFPSWQYCDTINTVEIYFDNIK